MSHKAWNDLTPQRESLVARGPQTLSVVPVTAVLGGMRPHVMLRVGEDIDSQLMMLTPSEARRVAIALLQAAEQVDAQKQPRHSN